MRVVLLTRALFSTHSGTHVPDSVSVGNDIQLRTSARIKVPLHEGVRACGQLCPYRSSGECFDPGNSLPELVAIPVLKDPAWLRFCRVFPNIVSRVWPQYSSLDPCRCYKSLSLTEAGVLHSMAICCPVRESQKGSCPIVLAYMLWFWSQWFTTVK